MEKIEFLEIRANGRNSWFVFMGAGCWEVEKFWTPKVAETMPVMAVGIRGQYVVDIWEEMWGYWNS